MNKDKLYIFDTTLRDGAQTQGVDFSIDDKQKISEALDSLGVDYIEGGWPGANPTDTEFFNKDHNFKNAKLLTTPTEVVSQSSNIIFRKMDSQQNLIKDLLRSKVF